MRRGLSEPLEGATGEQEEEKPPEVTFKGLLSGFRVIVTKDDSTGELLKRGLGDEEGDSVTLRPYEAMYLMRLNWLQVTDRDGNPVTFEQLVGRSLSENKRGWTKFLVYRDLRSRGYVVREGYGIRSDLRVYARGDYPGGAAKYTVIPINEGEKIALSEMIRMIETVYRMGKEPIIAVVERRGEIIYYRASKMNFAEN
jgi:tRNA-intron endonuclease